MTITTVSNHENSTHFFKIHELGNKPLVSVESLMHTSMLSLGLYACNYILVFLLLKNTFDMSEYNQRDYKRLFNLFDIIKPKSHPSRQYIN